MILLHGGLGHSGNWGYQVPALLEAGYRVVLLDSRGHGRSSTQDSRLFSYELMASDTLAVMDVLGLERAAVVVRSSKWSGAGGAGNPARDTEQTPYRTPVPVIPDLSR